MAAGTNAAIVTAGGVELLDHDQLAVGIECRANGIPGEAREAGIVRIVGVDGGIRIIARVMEIIDVEDRKSVV